MRADCSRPSLTPTSGQGLARYEVTDSPVIRADPCLAYPESMEFLVVGEAKTGFSKSEAEEDALNEEHWAYMDRFASDLVARGDRCCQLAARKSGSEACTSSRWKIDSVQRCSHSMNPIAVRVNTSTCR